MPDPTPHQRMVAHLMAGLEHLEAHRVATSDAIVAHLTANAEPSEPPPPTTED